MPEPRPVPVQIDPNAPRAPITSGAGLIAQVRPGEPLIVKIDPTTEIPIQIDPRTMAPIVNPAEMTDAELNEGLTALYQQEDLELENFFAAMHDEETDNSSNQTSPRYGSATSAGTTSSTSSSNRSSGSLGLFSNTDVTNKHPSKKQKTTYDSRYPNLTLAEKKQHKLIKNRESAASHRQRKKDYIQSLEEQVEALQAQNQMLSTQVKQLTEDNAELTGLAHIVTLSPSR
jgi:hypothetical protein